MENESIENNQNIGKSCRRKRTFVTIRDSVVNALQERPMGLDELSKKIKCSHATSLNHVLYLESIGTVRKSNYLIKKVKHEKGSEAVIEEIEKQLWCLK